MKDFAKTFYKSARWKKCRGAYIASRIMKDGGLCEECHEAVGYIVHHKQLLNQQNIDNPSVTLSFKNLEYVCKECHDKFEGHGLNRSNAVVLFDESGQPYPINPPFNSKKIESTGTDRGRLR